MKTALSLAVAGVLVTGSAALAVNTQVLNTTPAGTGNANSVLLPDNSGRTPVPAVVASATATPDLASAAGGNKGRGPVPAAGKTAAAPATGNDKGSLRTVPEPGDDKGGQRKAAEPDDDSGGHGSDD